jgi:hypothetical protein
MRIRTEAYAAVAAVALSMLTLLGARAGCELGLAHQRTASAISTVTQSPEVAISAPLRGEVDRAGAGLDTGMPYYSFAQRSIRL